MTFDEANKIVHIWGTYLEYCQGRLHSIFFSHIPESFLPFPKDTIEEALNIVAKHYHNMGNRDQVKLLQRSMGCLLFYEDDEEALLQAAKCFNDPKFREVVLLTLKKFHKDWIRTLDRARVKPPPDPTE
jgi:hypothetical protein